MAEICCLHLKMDVLIISWHSRTNKWNKNEKKILMEVREKKGCAISVSSLKRTELGSSQSCILGGQDTVISWKKDTQAGSINFCTVKIVNSGRGCPERLCHFCPKWFSKTGGIKFWADSWALMADSCMLQVGIDTFWVTLAEKSVISILLFRIIFLHSFSVWERLQLNSLESRKS